MSDRNNIYLVGIKGVGMCSLAVYLKQRGKHVSGSDVEEEFPTDKVLNDQDITVTTGFNAENIPADTDLVITTGAHGGLQNPEVVAAKASGIPVMTQAEEVGHIMQAYETGISVCGAHGKTTTSSMIAHVLRQEGLASSHLIGTPRIGDMYGGEYRGTDYFVAEADEYVNSPGVDETPRFMFQYPKFIICTNIDFDHPDVYSDIDAVKNAYKQFFENLEKNNGTLIYNENDKNLVELAKDVKNKIPYSEEIGKNAHIQLKVPGDHNISNASAVIVLCDELGLDRNKVIQHLGTFSGAKRRFEQIYEKNGTYLIDDYAHHPKEIIALLDTARSKFEGKRIVLIFQPHTFSRTAALRNGFIEVLPKADITYVLDIFGSAREKDAHGITSQSLVDEVSRNGGDNVLYETKNTLSEELTGVIKNGDVIITAGAGDVYDLHDSLIEVIDSI